MMPVTVHQAVVTRNEPSLFSHNAAEPASAVIQAPRHPQYADMLARVRSFDGKVVPHGQDVQELASAGFFHVGKQTISGYCHSITSFFNSFHEMLVSFDNLYATP